MKSLSVCLVLLCLIAISTAAAAGRSTRFDHDNNDNAIIPHEYVVAVRRDLSMDAWLRFQRFLRRAVDVFCGDRNNNDNDDRENDRDDDENGECALYDFYTIGTGFKAFAGRFPSGRLLRFLEEQVEVSAVYRNSRVHALALQQDPPSWGLDRIDQTDLPLDQRYYYSDRAGQGSTIYVLDTGIRISHEDFNGRASYGVATCRFCSTAEDGNGHGTHASSTAAGTEYGVAKNAQLVAVKVLGDLGMGSLDSIIAGLEYVANEAAGRNSTVVNMSLGSSANDILDQAVEELVQAGVHVAVAAGNEDQDACNVSPARAPSVVTVGATDSSDNLASFSNWGDCVDILAPGVDIAGAWIDSDQATNTISGTSMASPHVAGLLAEIVAEYPCFTPAESKEYLLKMATVGTVNLRDQDNTPNLLAFNGANSTTTVRF